MITFVRGRLVQVNTGAAVIEVGGIGYRVIIPLSLAPLLPQTGEECRLHTHYMVRDERAELYGFKSEKERDLFVLLLGVSGVGPKAALALLACLSPAEIERAVFEENAAVLQMVPGIGKKTAQRLLLELKDKLEYRQPRDRGPLSDAAEALISLGYRRDEALEAVKRAAGGGDAGDLEAILRSALGLLLKREDRKK
ncbi:MAG: Holliday junction branch migration protein RuvA [Ammonifex sp.]|jgi:Holliday junction DNA helicase RuvA|nr:MAG: Holliday junction branch migration protein RuvA [Ammonifex sp.]